MAALLVFKNKNPELKHEAENALPF
ncbi:uncharacterized protein METZ01_LOCUS163367 [marine metagenome]|uniref:Uncharacterized protein n=1 Tax=marine metagenome TaxID=408172 RepID=A0A382BBA8_9ZZZZ